MKNLLTFLLIVALTNFTLSAQSLLEGSISNEEGELVTAATVTLHHLNNDQLSKVLTVDETGYFILENISDGAYQLEVTTVDYEPIIVPNFQFPRDTDQVVGLSFDQPIMNDQTVITSNKPISKGYLNLAKAHE